MTNLLINCLINTNLLIGLVWGKLPPAFSTVCYRESWLECAGRDSLEKQELYLLLTEEKQGQGGKVQVRHDLNKLTWICMFQV